MIKKSNVRSDSQPAGGRGAVKATLQAFRQQEISLQWVKTFRLANQPQGFDCPGCAFPDKNTGRGIDSCEQGQKAIAWELTNFQADTSFFATHDLKTLRSWTDNQLEKTGRLTTPLRYNQETNRYEAISWTDALDLIAQNLSKLDPQTVAFYTSGRASNEAAFLWQLLARLYGSSHLPDSSNLCHEPSAYAMKDMLGVGKGTCQLDDFTKADLIMVMGQNPASNHPRMMVQLYEASKRGAKVIALNPLAERGFMNFADPKNPKDMILNQGHQVAGRVYRVKIGGDLAAIKGVIKTLLIQDRVKPVIDHEFISTHTQYYDRLVEDIENESWETIVAQSGLSLQEIEEIAQLYHKSQATIVTWCMGITHHENAVATIQMMINLLLLKGNIGKPGSGAVPVRGHSNVQGNRTMGATGLVPIQYLENMERLLGVHLQRQTGFDAHHVAKGLLDKTIKGFLALGGNFGSAMADSQRVLMAMGECSLTVSISTKLNRTHLYPGQVGLILPALGRTDFDGNSQHCQAITVEDSMSMTHASQGFKTPLSPEMLGEPTIIAKLGQALLPEHLPWQTYMNDYAQIREVIEQCMEGVFDGFIQYNQKIKSNGGFSLPNAATARQWQTHSGKAEFKIHAIPTNGRIHRLRAQYPKALCLMTIRSHDQFNTTIYSDDDRYRGVWGTRKVILMNIDDMMQRQLYEGAFVKIEALNEDGVSRFLHHFQAFSYDIQKGYAAGYFPELTALLAIDDVSLVTRTPVYKEVMIKVSSDSCSP